MNNNEVVFTGLGLSNRAKYFKRPIRYSFVRLLIKVYIVCFVFCCAVISSAKEIDNTHPDKPINDSTEILDRHMNNWISNAEKKMADQRCKSGQPNDIEPDQINENDKITSALHNEIDNSYTSFLFGRLETWAQENLCDDYILKKSTAESMYKFSSNLIIKIFGISSLIKVNDTYIGTDKLGHFISQGYGYYQQQALLSDGTILKIGHDLSEKMYGSATTGVMSYGDLNANYAGLQFWNEIWKGKNPYFICSDGRWKRTKRKFTFKDYVTSTWDESINCSTYSKANEEALKKFITTKEGQKYKDQIFCSEKNTHCAELRHQIQDPNLQKWLITPKCRL